MELVDAYNFMRKIIDNGIEKKYSTKNIKKGVNDYINVLKEQECLNKDDYLLLASVANRIDDLIGDKVRVLPNKEQLKNYRSGWVPNMNRCVNK